LVAREALQNRREDAFVALVDEHWGAMHRLARLLGDPASAREVVRSAWLDALERGEQPASLSTRAWLLGLVVDRLRPGAAPNQRTPAVDPAEFFDHRWRDHWRDDRPLPLNIDPDRLETALAGLPPGIAAVVLLRDAERLDGREVEAILNRPAEQQLALLHAGRTAIRAALAEAAP
jgi:RNA polymerase sigma-70 factor (ECF subfamily)